MLAILRYFRFFFRVVRFMISATVIDQLTEAVSNLLPKGVAGDIRKQINAVLASRLEDLGLVSREEFEVQQALLERLRTRLDALESEFSKLHQAEISPRTPGPEIHSAPLPAPGSRHPCCKTP